MDKHVIYDNYNFEEKDYRFDFEDWCDAHGLDPKEENIYEFINICLNDWWDDEFGERYGNLNTDLDCEILCVANLGFWNGRRQGYKECGKNIAKAISGIFSDSEEYREIYVEDGEVVGHGYHHDGVHHYQWRLIKKSASQSDIKKLKEQIYNGEDYSELLTKCTKSLAPAVAKIYGWSK